MVRPQRLASHLSFWGGWLCAVFWLSSGYGETKFIRLRHGTLVTGPAAARSASQLSGLAAATSGLFLVQFKQPLQPAERQELAADRVKLLGYVPDDAYLARLDPTQVRTLQSAAFVQWVGPYRPEYRLHPELLPGPSRASTGERQLVRVLLAPETTPADLLELRRRLSGARQTGRFRFGAVWQGEASVAQCWALAQAPSVIWIEPVRRPKLLDEVSAKIVGGPNATNGHATATQALGFDGHGVVVAVADSGLNNGDAATMHPDLFGRVDAFFWYGNLTNAADQHGHGTHVSGIIAGNGATGETDTTGAWYGLGVAPGAHLVVQRIFDAQGNPQQPSNPETLTRDASTAGALIGCQSWGNDSQGQYDLEAAQFDALVRDANADLPGDQPFLLVFAAGNAGPGVQTLDSPATAKNGIAVGASENGRTDLLTFTDGPEAMADFSSRGPCVDGRLKPDLVAPGTWIASLQSASASSQYAWSPISANYEYDGGTSQAAPHVAGAAAVWVQYYQATHTNAAPSPALIKAALINAATPLESLGQATPNQDEGWGRVNLTPLIGSPRRYDFVDQTVLLTNGQVFERQIVAASGTQALKITLAYTDVPGLPAAIPALVNDLDLELVSPEGRLYRGNQFEDGESVPDVLAPDNLNNVEEIRLRQPAAGLYRVRVRARHVVQDARVDTKAIDQDFALVTSGDLAQPDQGVLALNQVAYGVPGTIRIQLIDFVLANQATVSVAVWSTTQTNALTIPLQSMGTSGIFTGAVQTAAAPVTNDNRLHLSQGDQIVVTFQPPAPGTICQATARADLAPPIITGVWATNQFGQLLVGWHTDQPANSLVRYGPNSSLSAAATNLLMTQDHQVALGSLPAGSTNWFEVVSTDEAGNTSTNDNRGQFYRIVAQPAPLVLLVDDYRADGYTASLPLSGYTDALNQIRVNYQVWNVVQAGRYPNPNDLAPFRVVIWRINDSFYNTLNDTNSIYPAQQATLQGYLNQGGALLLASMEILSRLGSVPFVTNVLQVQSFNEDVGVPAIVGLNSDPISSGIALGLDYSAFPRADDLGLGPDFSDTFLPTTNAAPILFKSSSGEATGLRYPRTGQDSTGRVVFLSFPLDAVPLAGDPPNNRANLLRNILGFLAPGAYGPDTVALDSSLYTIPARVTIEVADADLSGQGQTTAKCYSDVETNGQPVVLNETTRQGVFRGFIALVAATNAPASGQLRAEQGDQIWAEHFDASSQSLVRAVASVDTVPPIISGVAVQPEYQDAQVSWTTSKRTDGLVQFGESAFLGRTAYGADLSFNHQLNLTGLAPNRLYYFRVVSRDAAGNVSVDDNQGQLYTFQTLQPIIAPWSDSLDTGATNWTVIPSDQGSAAWQLGVPNNGRETSAHSPPNAWGSNLNGTALDFADTTLVSPAIDLTGGALATVRFWQSYGFASQSGSVIYELGQVNVSTDNGNTWNPLAEFNDASDGWEKVELDLTPYLGRVIRIGWYYGLYALNPLPRPGWLVDDVSVTVTNAPHGFILITNNLAQARFTLAGPVTQSGQGWSLGLSNAPLGQYVLTFKPVPYYQTPPPQTNTLSAGAPLIFGGYYTFVDANHNGISDAWEQQYFGAVATNHPPETDTDHDGASDYAEFIAGTDPTNPLSYLHLMRPVWTTNGTVRLNWASVPGRAYRLQSSANGTVWNPASAWLRADSTISSLVLPTPTNGPVSFFRLEVRP